MTVLASVVITSFNYARFVGEAIESALAQSYRPTEVVVVDDGSTDGSRQVIARYDDRVRSVLKENGGQASALNAGFRASRGDVVVFLDSDDVLLADALREAVCRLGDPEVMKVHWQMPIVDALGRRTGGTIPSTAVSRGDVRDGVLEAGPGSYRWPPTSGNAWARRFLERVLPMPEEEFRTNSDVYLAALAPLFGRVEALGEPQSLWRVHGRNSTWSAPPAQKAESDARRLEVTFGAMRSYGRELGLEVDVERLRKRSRWQLHLAARELDPLIPQGESFLLADQETWDKERLPGRRAVSFLERGGVYWGPPPDDAAAIAELERQRRRGLNYFVFAWPHLWWLEHYAAFTGYVRSRYRCLLENERLVVFELSGAGGRE